MHSETLPTGSEKNLAVKRLIRSDIDCILLKTPAHSHSAEKKDHTCFGNLFSGFHADGSFESKVSSEINKFKEALKRYSDVDGDKPSCSFATVGTGQDRAKNIILLDAATFFRDKMLEIKQSCLAAQKEFTTQLDKNKKVRDVAIRHFEKKVLLGYKSSGDAKKSSFRP